MRSLYLLTLVLLTYSGIVTAQTTPFTYSTTCQNDSVKFIIADADQVGIDSVKWNFGDPASGAADSSKKMNGTHLYNTLGDHTVTLTAYRGGTGTNTTAIITIVAPVIYDFGPTDQTLCDSTTITLTAPTVAGAVYEWQDGSTGQSIVVDTSVTYKVRINGCLVPDSVNIFYTPVPEIELGDDLVLCLGENIQLDATAQNCTYLWSTGDTRSTLTVHSDVPTGPVEYSVTADAKGCGLYRDTITITFTGSPYPFSLGADTVLCPGESFFIDATTPGGSNYRWGNGARTPSTTVRSRWDLWVLVNINNTCDVLDTILVRFWPDRNVDLGNDTTICKGETLVLQADFGTANYRWQDTSKQATFYVRETGYYWVRAQVGRCVSSDTIHVTMEDTLRVNLGRDTTLCNGEVYMLHPRDAGVLYKWQDSTSIPYYPITQPGTYALLATNSCGQSTDEVNVLYQDCDCQVFLPTAFTPNGDGLNDYWRPKFRCEIADFKLSLYNRWGQRVYYTTDPQIGWKGTKQGGRVPAGTYVWVMDYTILSTDKQIRKTGAVTVIY